MNFVNLLLQNYHISFFKGLRSFVLFIKECFGAFLGSKKDFISLQ